MKRDLRSCAVTKSCGKIWRRVRGVGSDGTGGGPAWRLRHNTGLSMEIGLADYLTHGKISNIPRPSHNETPRQAKREMGVLTQPSVPKLRPNGKGWFRRPGQPPDQANWMHWLARCDRHSDVKFAREGVCFSIVGRKWITCPATSTDTVHRIGSLSQVTSKKSSEQRQQAGKGLGSTHARVRSRALGLRENSYWEERACQTPEAPHQPQ